jgi:ribosome-associated protein
VSGLGPGAEPRHIAQVAALGVDAKMGRDIIVIDVSAVFAIVDYFVIGHGTNDRQVRAIVDEVEARVAEACGVRPRAIEGLDTNRWVLMDYGSVVVHVFDEETRAYYELERLWRDMPRLDWVA